MHEFTLAQNIVEIMEETARNNHATRVTEIVLEIGTLAGVEIPALDMALESLKPGTLLENAVIRLNIVESIAVCNSCKYEYKPDDFFSICPKCENYGATIIKGKELLVKSITTE